VGIGSGFCIWRQKFCYEQIRRLKPSSVDITGFKFGLCLHRFVFRLSSIELYELSG